MTEQIKLHNLSRRRGWKGKNKWQVWWPEPNLPNGRTKTFARQDEAIAFKNKITPIVLKGGRIDLIPKTMTFETVALEWFDQLDLAPLTMRGYWLILSEHVIPHFGPTPQNAIGRDDVLSFVDWLREPRTNLPKGYAPKTIRDRVSVLSLIFKYAIHKRYRTDNPAANIKVPVPIAPKIKSTDRNILDIQDFEKIAPFIRDPYKSLWWLLHYTGVRPSEACGFVVRDFSFVNSTLYVSSTFNYVHSYRGHKAGTHRGDPKTRSGFRETFIPRSLAEDIQRVLESNAVRLGRPLTDDDPLFLAVRVLRPLVASDLRRYIIKPALEAAGYNPDIRTYDIRHAAATFWIDARVPMPMVDRLMGHSPGSGVAERTYYHPGDEELRKAQEAMAAAHAALSDDVPLPPAEATDEDTAEVIELADRRRQA